MSKINKRVNFEDDIGVVKPDMRVIHTGHIGKPQFPTVGGPLEMQRQPQRARVQMVQEITPTKEFAMVWEPPVMKYTQHYSRVESHSDDLERQVNPPEVKEQEDLDRMFQHLRNVKSGFVPIYNGTRNFV